MIGSYWICHSVCKIFKYSFMSRKILSRYCSFMTKFRRIIVTDQLCIKNTQNSFINKFWTNNFQKFLFTTLYYICDFLWKGKYRERKFDTKMSCQFGIKIDWFRLFNLKMSSIYSTKLYITFYTIFVHLSIN